MIIFLYGANEFKMKQKRQELYDKFRREIDPSEFNMSSIEGVKLTVAQLSELVGSVSMFVRKRFVVINDIFANKDDVQLKEILGYFKDKASADHIIVICQVLDDGSKKKLSKTKKELLDYLSGLPYAQEFRAWSQSDYINWIKNVVTEAGGQITGDAITALFGLIGENIWQLESELTKLVGLKKAKLNDSVFKIEVSDVKSVVHGAFEENIFALIDAIGERNKSRAVKLLEEELMAGQSADQLLAMIIRQFKLIMSTRDALERGYNERQIEQELGVKPWVCKKLIGQSRNYTLVALKNIFTNLLRLDMNVKTGQIDMISRLDIMIAKL